MLVESGDATSENKEDRSRDIKEIYMIVVDVFPVRVFNNSRGCGWRRRVSLSNQYQQKEKEGTRYHLY